MGEQLTWHEGEPEYDFQSALWVRSDGNQRLVIERQEGRHPDMDADDAGYDVLVLGPDGAGTKPQHRVAENISERAAYDTAIDFMGDLPESDGGES